MIIPALIAVPATLLDVLTTDITWIAIGFILQGMCGGGMQGQMPIYLAERSPTEVRATASAFCFHQGAIWGGFVALVLSFFAVYFDLGFAISMMVGTCVRALSFACPLLFSPETRGKVPVADLQVT
jgi:MFS transporter, SHS family, lactate transporter